MTIAIETVTARDGRAMTTRVAGPRAGLPVVLLHGQMHTSSCWIGTMDSELTQYHRLIAPDMAGHGGSDMPRDGDETWLADDLADLLARLDVERPVLVGWSFGSVVASAFADSGRPTRGIVLVGAGTRASGPAGLTLAQMRELIAITPTSASSPDALHTVAVDIFRELLSADPAVEQQGIVRMVDVCRHVPLAAAARAIQIADGLAIRPETRLLIATTVYDNAAFYARYDGPILQIHGVHDALRPLAEPLERAALFRDGETEYWKDSGHAPFDDEPERFVRRLSSFCASL